MSFSSIFLSERNGFNVCFSRWSRCGFSNVSSQKKNAFIARRASVEAECALVLCIVDDVDAVDVDGVCGEGDSLVAECDLVSIFGVVIGEREGGSGISVGMTGVVFGFCGGGIN